MSNSLAQENTHHHFNYIELPATDLEAMKKFYGQAFGWTFVDWGEDYVAVHGAGVEGGFDRNSAPREASRHGVLVILYSDSLDASENAIISAGGTITIKTYAFPGGRRFHFTDPSGNELAVWSPV